MINRNQRGINVLKRLDCHSFVRSNVHFDGNRLFEKSDVNHGEFSSPIHSKVNRNEYHSSSHSFVHDLFSTSDGCPMYGSIHRSGNELFLVEYLSKFPRDLRPRRTRRLLRVSQSSERFHRDRLVLEDWFPGGYWRPWRWSFPMS